MAPRAVEVTKAASSPRGPTSCRDNSRSTCCVPGTDLALAAALPGSTRKIYFLIWVAAGREAGQWRLSPLPLPLRPQRLSGRLVPLLTGSCY